MSMHLEPRRQPRRACRQDGLTLIELVVALALAGVMLTSLWSAWQLMLGSSQNPLVVRQQLAIAQSLLREIELQPLSGSTKVGTCRAGYASVMDYDGLTMPSITDADCGAITNLSAYGATVSVSKLALNGVPQAYGYWITVTTTGPDNRPLKLALWRSQR